MLPSAAPVAAGGLQDERFHAYRAVRALLQRMAMGSPVVLILDDVHWADDASLELIAHLLRRPPPAARADRARVPRRAGAEQPARGAGGRRAATASSPSIELGPLTQAEADALLGTPAQPYLYEQSGGNPFYLEELSRAPVDRGGAASRDAIGVPSGVAAALGQEIGGLPERARALAWGGAVAGEPFDLDLAAAAGDLGEDEALAAIDELLGSRVAVGTESRAAIASATRSCAAPSTTGPARRGGCRRTPVPPRRSPRGPGSLAARAHHVEHSARVGDDAAAAVLEQAGHQAAARAPAIAARWFDAALRLLGSSAADDPFRRLGLLVPLAGALAATGRLERALDTLVEALDLVEMADLRVRLIAACAACENLLGRHDAAHARLLAALDALADQQSAAAAALHAELAADALYDSDFDAMREWAVRAVDTARALEDRGLEALATALLCFAEYNLGNAAAARRRARGERGAARRAARRSARDPDRRAVLPRLRRVLLRALRRLDPPPAPRDQPVAGQRPGPVRRADAGRARARAGDCAGGCSRRRRRRTRRSKPRGWRATGSSSAGRWSPTPGWRPRSATSTTRAPPATRRSRCSTASTTACSPAPRTPTSA